MKVASGKWQKSGMAMALSHFFVYTPSMNFRYDTATRKHLRRIFFTVSLFSLISQACLAQQTTESLTPKERLIEDIAVWVGNEEGIPTENIEVQARDRRFRVPNCQNTFGVEFAFGAKTNVRVTCPSEDWRATLRIQIRRKTEALVFTRARSAGDILSSSDIAVELIDSSLGSNKLQQVDAEGRVLNQDVQDGELVRPNQLEDTTLVYVANQLLRSGDEVDPSKLAPVSRTYSETKFGQRLDPSVFINSVLTRNVAAGSTLSTSDFATANQTVVIKTLLERGTLIDPSSVALEMRTEKLPQDAITDLSQLSRAVAKRRLTPGSILRFVDISIEPHVVSGQTVTLKVKRSQFTVTVDMLATEDGYLGDRIRLRNKESNQFVFATVIGVGLVERR